MKKIGVVTYAHCENFGAELQACALCRAICQVSHEKVKVEVVWFERAPLSAREQRAILFRGIINRILRNPVSGLCEVFLLGLKIVKRRFRSPNQKERDSCEKRRQAFEAFWDAHEPHSPRVDYSCIANMDYDVLVAGSDQIWNWRLTGDVSPYLLLIPGLSDKVRKVSYAASVGVNRIDARHEPIYRKGLSALHLISVRETQGRDLLQPFSPGCIEVVCDPTLLLNADEWLAYEDERLHVEGDYVLVYTLNSSRRFWEKVTSYAEANGLRIVNLFGRAPREIDAVEIDTAGPSDFLHLIRGAKMVVTNSFHGTIFSVNFRVPFVSVLNPASAVNSRIQSIAHLLGLGHRVLFDDADMSLTDLDPIDYDATYLRLDELRRSSWRFLSEAING